MTAEEYLSQITDIDLRIRSLEGELSDSELEADPEYRKELAERIGENIVRAKELKLRIRAEIQNVQDNRLCTLLSEKYVRGRSWEQVADAVGMKSVKHVREGLHSQALEAFRQANENIFENTT